MSMSYWIRGACSTAAEKGAPADAPVPAQRVNMTKARRLVAELDRELKRVRERHPRDDQGWHADPLGDPRSARPGRRALSRL